MRRIVFCWVLCFYACNGMTSSSDDKVRPRTLLLFLRVRLNHNIPTTLGIGFPRTLYGSMQQLSWVRLFQDQCCDGVPTSLEVKSAFQDRRSRLRRFPRTPPTFLNISFLSTADIMLLQASFAHSLSSTTSATRPTTSSASCTSASSQQ